MIFPQPWTVIIIIIIITFLVVDCYVLQNKNEEQGKLAEEIMEQYQAANNKVKKLEMDLDAALREKVYWAHPTISHCSHLLLKM